MRRWILPLALAAELALFSSGCSVFRRKRAAPSSSSPPPPPVAAPIPEPKPSAPILSAPKLPTPGIEAPKQATQTAPPPPVSETPKPKARRRPPRRPAEPAPQPGPEVLAPPPAVTPRLEEVLTAKQRQELAATLDGNVTEARRMLTALAGRTLTREQNDAAARVRSFLQQALEMRNSDIGTAVELSRRALLLARDLATAR